MADVMSKAELAETVEAAKKQTVKPEFAALWWAAVAASGLYEQAVENLQEGLVGARAQEAMFELLLEKAPPQAQEILAAAERSRSEHPKSPEPQR